MPCTHRRVVLMTLLAAALGAPATAQAACPPEPTTTPFRLYLDPAPYFIAPGGDFEASPPSWTLTGGAVLQPKARINDFGGAQVLRLPMLATATSPPVCVDASRTKLRFDVKAAWLLTRLQVAAVLPGGHAVPLGGHTAVLDTLLWGLTAPIPLSSRLGIDGDEQLTVRLRITALSGLWMVDDVAVDPYRNG